MKTEKQVEKMLEAIDEETVNILNRKRKEYTKLYNETEKQSENRLCASIWLLALMDIANALGYHLKDENVDLIRLLDLLDLKPLA